MYLYYSRTSLEDLDFVEILHSAIVEFIELEQSFVLDSRYE